jgi:uncharacterized protein YbbC (DUF1343 family)/CubicO group peptidase (beta-lactamase class C family)
MMNLRFTVFLLIFATGTAYAGLPEAKPGELGFDAGRLSRIDATVESAIARKQFPGAVVLVGRHGKIAYVKAYGNRAIVPNVEPMTRDTIFDMASLTKPMATATSMMILLESGKYKLDDSIIKHMPEFDSNGKRAITIDHLLRHRAGLIPDNALKDYLDGPTKAWERLAGIDLQSAPGEKFAYSDVGFLILGKLVERLSKQPLDQFALKNIFEPLGMTDTSYLPPAQKKSRIAPTEPYKSVMMRGNVHDPRANELGGVAGHAGLFSTVDDVAIYAQTLLNGGVGPNGQRILAPLTVRKMIDAADTPPGQRRGLGWDVDTPYSSLRGAFFNEPSFGHTGFTGTSLWIDPETKSFVIMLTSRLHPDGKGNPLPTRAELATIVASSIVDTPIVTTLKFQKPLTALTPAGSIRPVSCGIDVLAATGFKAIQGKRVGLVTNHTGRTKSGETTIDVLHKAPGVKLVRLFSPEHGIRGLVDAEVGDDVDAKTGLPIASLYGKTRKPSKKQLEGIDVIVYDIQDIGTRFYTYISTLGLVLESAKENGLSVIVLDRPNPIGGVIVSGPVRDVDYGSFIAFHELPVRHGMTVGEMARLFNTERFIGANLTVIPCEGWQRVDTYDRTGLTWVNPSPNMRSLTEALLYPGIGLLEASNFATGRGTDTPFERVGAPYIDPQAFSKALNQAALKGVRFVPIRFTPKERQFVGKECGGVQILVTDWSTFDPIDTGVGIAVVLRKLYPKDWQPAGFLRMLADRDAYEALIRGKSLSQIQATWQSQLAEFKTIRAKYLLYR